MRVNYAIVFVSEMGRSVTFYRDIVGLALKFESPHWSEFDTGDATLALHRSDMPNPDTDPQKEPAGRCRVGFAVPDLAVFHEKMMQQDVPCVEQPREIFGSKIAQYADPDGMAFSVGQGGNWDK